MARHGIGSKGLRIPLLTNHFKVGVNQSDGFSFHCSSVITSTQCLFSLHLLINYFFTHARRKGSSGGSPNPAESEAGRKKQYQSKTMKVQAMDSEHFQEAVGVQVEGRELLTAPRVKTSLYSFLFPT